MSKFVTIRFSHGINMRPFADGDVAGELSKKQGGGVLAIHESREAACAAMDKFWAAHGFKNMGIGR
jgi:hypothetical protein